MLTIRHSDDKGSSFYSNVLRCGIDKEKRRFTLLQHAPMPIGKDPDLASMFFTSGEIAVYGEHGDMLDTVDLDAPARRPDGGAAGVDGTSSAAEELLGAR